MRNFKLGQILSPIFQQTTQILVPEIYKHNVNIYLILEVIILTGKSKGNFNLQRSKETQFQEYLQYNHYTSSLLGLTTKELKEVKNNLRF